MIKEINFPEIITELPRVDLPFEGGIAYLMDARDKQVVFMEFQEDLMVLEHFHSAQWGIVVEGEMIITIDGKELLLTKGDTYYIPEGVLHKAEIKAGYKDITIYNQSDRFKVKE